MNLHDIDLEGAELGDELNHLAFDPADYCDLNTVVRTLRTRRKIAGVNLPDLAVNGEVIRDSFGRYLATKHLSSSVLKEVYKTPLHFYCAMNEPAAKRQSKAFDLGTFCHLAFLEPDRFRKVVVEPKALGSTTEGVDKLLRFWEKKLENERVGDGRSLVNYCRRLVTNRKLSLAKIDGKRQLLQLYRERSGFAIVDHHTAEVIKLIKRHYYAYGGGLLPDLLAGSIPECSFYGHDPATGLPVKIRPDGIVLEENAGANLIISFKTTSADSIGKFAYDAAKYKYHLAEGMYLEVASQVTGRKFTGVVTVMLQTVPPYLPAVFWWDAEHLANGKYQYHQALQTVKACHESGLYPGFDAFAESPDDRGLIPLSLPEWVLRETQPIGI
ncbi:PD-(D/E)XK nuclease-like domain-containing protein [Larkinella humicola]|uniref:Putative exodeoxyribonuclease 8 PDDEXK-like domain-containing protein n=1 Tax=Larkinella humicola TaxID=2607654 RepID=A0A5N1JLA1_9BACT|nr:PD-(D/E)XK nuclease-like domain-containing protein [Larkinella humicola]KAA9357270.1 hypothetical protein F0P93_05910 [Larkinella humicola]